MNFENIIVYKDGAIGVIKINRAEVRNALDSRTCEEIECVLDQWENHDGIRLIVITGEGEKVFASGADLKQLQERKAIDALKPGLQGVCTKIESSSKVTIAAINGYALGGGCELALACDIRIATENAKLGFPELNLAIIPGGGGTQRLARVVGKGRALELILTGAIISSEKAESYGLVTCVVPLEQLWETVLDYANKIIKKGPIALKLAKLVVNHGFDVDIKSGLLMEKLAQSILFNSSDKQEGIAAFLEKREPIFKGK